MSEHDDDQLPILIPSSTPSPSLIPSPTQSLLVPSTPSFMVIPSTPSDRGDHSDSPNPTSMASSNSGSKSETRSNLLERARPAPLKRGPSLAELSAVLKLHHPDKFEGPPDPPKRASTPPLFSRDPNLPDTHSSSSTPESTTRPRLAASISSAALLRSKSQSSLSRENPRRPSVPSLELIGARLSARRGSGTSSAGSKSAGANEMDDETRSAMEIVKGVADTPTAKEEKMDADDPISPPLVYKRRPTEPLKPSSNADGYFPLIVATAPKSSADVGVWKRDYKPINPKPVVESVVSIQTPQSVEKHPLQHEWTFYYHPPQKSGSNSPGPTASPSAAGENTFKANLKDVGSAKTVEEFASFFQYLKRPSQMESGSSLYVFKDGIMPLWETSANASGGKWSLTLNSTNLGERSVGAGRPEVVDKCWTYLVLGLIGEELDEQDQVCGAVLSKRSPSQARIQLWTRHLTPVEPINSVGKRLISLLEIGSMEGIQFAFGPHHIGPQDPPNFYASSKAMSHNYIKVNQPLPKREKDWEKETQERVPSPLSLPQGWRTPPGLGVGVGGGNQGAIGVPPASGLPPAMPGLQRSNSMGPIARKW